MDKTLPKESIDLSTDENPQEPLHFEKEPWHPDKAKMKLAYFVLKAIYSFLILTVVCFFAEKLLHFDTTISNLLFELFKSALVPMITYILGYYFASSK